MNSTSYDINSSLGITQMTEAMLETNSNQPLITTNDVGTSSEDKHLLSNQDNSLQNHGNNMSLESSPTASNIAKKQESLISIYDNSNDSGTTSAKQQINKNSFPLIGILGRNQRSQAFTTRLRLSGFPKPILCDRNSTDFNLNEKSNYVSNETFFKQSPSIILVTDSLINNIDDFINHDKQQLIIDARESIDKYFSNSSAHFSTSIPGSYRAFGNLSNWEIENGTQRVGVTVEQASPLNLIKFIHDLNCFSRGIIFLDQYSYNNEQLKSFRNCLFPFVATIIIFSVCFILSMLENKRNNYYYQACSIAGSTSLTLLSLLFLIKPILELSEFIYSFILKNQNKENAISNLKFVQRWLQSRRCLAWYSLVFALLHLLFLLFSKNNFHQETTFYPVFLGLFALVLLCVLSFVYLPWISESLLWREYHLLTTYLGPFCLVVGFIHVFISWKHEYYHAHQNDLFTLKFLSMFLPLIVLFLIFIIHGVIHPASKLFQWKENRPRQSKTSTIATKDTSLLP